MHSPRRMLVTSGNIHPPCTLTPSSPGHSHSPFNTQLKCLVLCSSFLSSPSRDQMLPPLDPPGDLYTHTIKSLLWVLIATLHGWIEKHNNLNTKIIMINCWKESSSCYNTRVYSYHQLCVLVDYVMPGKRFRCCTNTVETVCKIKL